MLNKNVCNKLNNVCILSIYQKLNNINILRQKTLNYKWLLCKFGLYKCEQALR